MFLVNLLLCFCFIDFVNSGTASNSADDDYANFFQLYQLMKRFQLRGQSKQITNNVFIIPMPLLLPPLPENKDVDPNDDDHNEYNTRKLISNDYKYEAAFRDFEATNPVNNDDLYEDSGKLARKQNSNSPDDKNYETGPNDSKNMRKPITSSVYHFVPSTHRNYKLLPHRCGIGSTSDRITGGKNATLGQYPWMARVGFVNVKNIAKEPSFRCGGTLISKSHVLTAAHCVTNLPVEIFVDIIRLGEYNTDTYVDCVNTRCADKIIDYKPKTITAHENYGKPAARNDIAIILLKTPVKFSEWIVPICLPRDEHMDLDLTNLKAEVAGWGYYDLSIDKGSTILQTAQLPIIRSQPCAKAFRGLQINYKKQLCVGGELGIDSCNGDSGGPLMKMVSVNKEARYIQFGIVSLGAKYCGLTTAPAIYTKITYYMDWILEHL